MDTYTPTSSYDYCTNATVSQTVNGWAWPVPASKVVGSYYTELNTKGVHKGIDIGELSGQTYQENIVAAHDGTVTKSWSDIYCGQMMVISASGTPYYQGYQHIIPSSVVVGVGTVVKAGQPLGKVGKYGATTCGGPDTFYHLHFSVEKGNWLSYYSSPLTNSVDPCTVLQCPPKS
jgi:murein DD-endopeptidase MepM/ murein hydrolase activator NlpD